MKVLFAIMVSVMLAASCAASEMVVSNVGVAVLQDFDGFEGTFESLPPGFAVSSSGSNCLTEADSGEFKPAHSGGTSEGACRPWDLGDGDYALGYQPTSTEFTPGFFMAAVSNGTGEKVTMIEVSYEVVCYNNENRSSRLDLEYSDDGITFVRIGGGEYESPSREDADPFWCISKRSVSIDLKEPVLSGARFWLRWYGDDAGGAGSRDEYGIDDVRVLLRSGMGTVVTVR